MAGQFNPEDPPALAFAAWMGDQLQPIFQRSSVPIVGRRESSLEDTGTILVVSGDRMVTQRGTGTLFKISDQHFLVSASHVLELFDNPDETSLIPYDNPAALQQLTGRVVRTNRDLDLAVLLLEEEVVEGLDSSRFLTLDLVDCTVEDVPGWYFLHGYPFVTTYTSKDLLTTSTSSLTYRTGLYAGRTSSFLKYDPEDHLLLGYDGTCHHADDGSPAELPSSFGGISGCSVWRGFAEHHYMDKWEPSMARIVGVQTKVYPDARVFQATRWSGVAFVLWTQFPETREELRDHLSDDLVKQFEKVCSKRGI